MFSRIHEKLGTAGFIISIVALVAALGGGAYAAQQGLNSKQKKQVKNIAKQFAGKPGPQGPQGPAGPTGAAGAKGDAGAAGAAGKDGAAGQSVTGAPINTGGVCGPQTGVKYTLGATSTNVCNGEDGEDGETGFTETLPSGKTLAGKFSIPATGPTAGKSAIKESPGSISFGIPLAAKPTVKIMKPLESDTDCPGGAGEPFPKKPEAKPGFLCIYLVAVGGEATLQTTFPGKEGTYLLLKAKEEEPEGSGEFKSTSAFGAWAVTAP